MILVSERRGVDLWKRLNEDNAAKCFSKKNVLAEEISVEKRYIPVKIRKELYAKSGNRCSFPGCDKELIGDGDCSEICHIEGVNPNSARFNSKLSNEEVNSYDNLILLCRNHHNLVDECKALYTVEKLRRMKYEHEAYVSQRMKSDRNSEFYQELQTIFQEYKFDETLLSQSFDAPFKKGFLDRMEEGHKKICSLLNEKCAVTLPGQEREQLLSFANLVRYVAESVAMVSKEINGFIVPSNDPKKLEVIREITKKLQSMYQSYRFGDLSESR